MASSNILVGVFVLVGIILASSTPALGQALGGPLENQATGIAAGQAPVAGDVTRTPEAKPAANKEVAAKSAADAKAQQDLDPKANSGEAAQGPAECKSWPLCASRCAANHQACAWTFGVILVLIVAVAAWLLWASQRTSTSSAAITQLSAAFFFWLGLGYLALLLVVAAFYVLVWTSASPLLLGGVLPVGVPWFGALGAVVISLEGVFAYGQREWDAKYNYWHIGRPLFGAVLGIVAFFTFVLLLSSSGTVPGFLNGEVAKTMAKDYIIYYVVAFLVGYREETFRELIRRVTDMILKPATSPANAPAVTFKSNGAIVPSLAFGTVAAGASKALTVEIVNSGKADLIAPKAVVDGEGSSTFAITKDLLAAATDLKAAESRTIEVTFTPAKPGLATGTLRVTATNLSNGATLALSGGQ